MKIGIVVSLACVAVVGYSAYASLVRSPPRASAAFQKILEPLAAVGQHMSEVGAEFDVVVAPMEGGKLLVWGRAVSPMTAFDGPIALQAFLKGVPKGTALIDLWDEPHVGDANDGARKLLRLSVEMILEDAGFRVQTRRATFAATTRPQ